MKSSSIKGSESPRLKRALSKDEGFSANNAIPLEETGKLIVKALSRTRSFQPKRSIVISREIKDDDSKVKKNSGINTDDIIVQQQQQQQQHGDNNGKSKHVLVRPPSVSVESADNDDDAFLKEQDKDRKVVEEETDVTSVNADVTSSDVDEQDEKHLTSQETEENEDEEEAEEEDNEDNEDNEGVKQDQDQQNAGKKKKKKPKKKKPKKKSISATDDDEPIQGWTTQGMQLQARLTALKTPKTRVILHPSKGSVPLFENTSVRAAPSGGVLVRVSSSQGQRDHQQQHEDLALQAVPLFEVAKKMIPRSATTPRTSTQQTRVVETKSDKSIPRYQNKVPVYRTKTKGRIATPRERFIERSSLESLDHYRLLNRTNSEAVDSFRREEARRLQQEQDGDNNNNNNNNNNSRSSSSFSNQKLAMPTPLVQVSQDMLVPVMLTSPSSAAAGPLPQYRSLGARIAERWMEMMVTPPINPPRSMPKTDANAPSVFKMQEQPLKEAPISWDNMQHVGLTARRKQRAAFHEYRPKALIAERKMQEEMPSAIPSKPMMIPFPPQATVAKRQGSIHPSGSQTARTYSSSESSNAKVVKKVKKVEKVVVVEQHDHDHDDIHEEDLVGYDSRSNANYNNDAAKIDMQYFAYQLNRCSFALGLGSDDNFTSLELNDEIEEKRKQLNQERVNMTSAPHLSKPFNELVRLLREGKGEKSLP